MVKADVRKAEPDAWRVGIGRAVERTMQLRGWSLKEFSGAVDRDARQCARWMDGTERPQLDTVFAVETLRAPFLQALAELAGASVEITTAITIRSAA